MKTIKKRTVLCTLILLTLSGILYFCLVLSWAPARQKPPPTAPGAEVPSPEAPTAPGESPVPVPEPTTPGESPVPEPEPAAPAESPIPEPGTGPVMVSEHFARDEYRCDCPGYCDGFPAEPEPELLARIEALRQAVCAPVIITSGVRCQRRNEEVGGVSWSFHKRGAAADLYSPGVPVGTLAQLAKDCGLNVLPYYGSGYVHVEIV